MQTTDLPALHSSRAWLLAEHAVADARGNHGRKRWIRSALGAVEASIAALSERPVRVNRSLRVPVPDTLQGDYSPTLYAPEYARTSLSTVLEARP